MFDLQGIRDRLRTGALVLTRRTPEPVRKFEDWTDGESWTKILGWSDSQVNAWAQQFFLHWLNMRTFADQEAMATRLAAGDLKGVEDLIGAAQARAVQQDLPKIQALATQAAGGGMKITGAVFGLKFDRVNPAAVSFINRYAFDLIQGINMQQRAGIQKVILDAFKQGGHPREQAKEIVQHIGLLPRQRAALQRRSAQLKAAALKRARPKDFVTGGAREWWKLDPSQKQKVFDQINRYSDKLLKQRALTIARTETIRASNMGQLEAWKESARQGLIDPANTVRVWITTKDDRTCEFCRPLNGQVVAFEAGEWTSTIKRSDGSVVSYTALTPPLHPNCRCAMGLRIGKAPLRVQVETQGKPGSGARKPKADPWADKVKKLIEKGIQTEKDAVKIGKLIAAEIDRLEDEALDERLAPLQKRVRELETEAGQLRVQYNALFDDNGYRRPEVPREEVARLDQAWADKVAVVEGYRKKIRQLMADKIGQKNPDRDIRLQVLRRIREMGPPPDQPNHPVIEAPQTDIKAQEWLRTALQYMPRAWVQRSYDQGEMILQTDPRRGFYSEKRWGPSVLCIDTPRGTRTALHEMMHRMEQVFGTGGITALEWAFYERRTKGYALRKLNEDGGGYADWEVYRKDKFLAKYFGKDYRPARNIPDYQGYLSNWELLSMGVEYEFFGPNDWDADVIMRHDPDLRAFILGILAGL